MSDKYDMNNLISNDTVEKAKEISEIVFNEEQFTKQHSDRIINKYLNRYPILLWTLGSNIIIKKRKFIVPGNITIGQFLYVLRKQLIDFNSSDGLFLIVEGAGIMLPSNQIVEKIWKEYNVNGFIRLALTKENTFG
jgi:GABA(A) receptor-associated protein